MKVKFKLFLILLLSLLFILLGIVLSFFILRMAYPIKYKEEVLKYSKEYDLDPFLVFSVIKVESDFDSNAKSSKGAKGLMQIIDSTSYYIANNLGVNGFNIFNPDTNIMFGCYYLRYLVDKFNDVSTALCAYNAGEGNVKNWLKDNSYSNNGITINNIPYKETREYLIKVNKNFKIYKKIYGDFVDKS